MGLLKELLLLPAAPVRGTIWIAEQVQEAAEQEFYDPAVIRHQLEQVEELHSSGQINDDEAEQWEDDLLARLAESRVRLGRREGM